MISNEALRTPRFIGHPMNYIIPGSGNSSIMSSGNLSASGTLSNSSSKFIVDDEEDIPLETRIVDEEVIKELQCGICLQILASPKQCKNGHLFCASCILQYIQKKPECPQCRGQLNESDLARSLFVERHLLQLKVYCKYHFCKEEDLTPPTITISLNHNKNQPTFDLSTPINNNNASIYSHSHMIGDEWVPDPAGCPAIFPLEVMVKHERDCEYAPASCKYSSLCTRLRRKDVAEHEENCPHRPFECPHCNTPIEYSGLDEHLEVCTMVVIQCVKCGDETRRGELEVHKRIDCMEELVPCHFMNEGCGSMLLRKELHTHLNTNAAKHMLLMKQSYDEKIEGMRHDFKSQLKVREEKIRQLERLVTGKETSIEWKVKNWSVAKKKNYIQSDKFSFANLNWFIGLYTDGDNEESRGFIAVYLFLDGPPFKGKNIAVEFNIQLVNQRDPHQSVTKEFKTTFPIKGGQGWGDRQIIRGTRVNEEVGFLKEDCLTVQVEITKEKVKWIL